MKRSRIDTKYAIIGNSIAGVSCVEGIREVDTKGQITIISDEALCNYSRPLISYYLGNRIGRDKISFRDGDFYREKKVNLLLNTKAKKILDTKREILLDSGSMIRYGKLLISTGGSPIVPSIEGMENVKEGIFTFTRYRDVEDLINYIESNHIKEATVLGAGLIGLKATEGLIGRGVNVTIIELANRLLANTFDTIASGILEKTLKELGCNIIKEDTVIRIVSDKGRIKRVELKSGKEINTKLLIIAIGVKPNLELVKGTSIDCDKGIVVDEYLKTSQRDIYAAGDVTQCRGLLSQRGSVIAIWPVAARQGRIAGLNMSGERRKYAGLFAMNSVELAGLPTISFGITNPESQNGYEVLAIEDSDINFYRKIVLKNNRIVGGIFLGDIERAGIFSGLIKNRIDVSSFKSELLSDEFGLLVLPREYRKHLVVGEGIEV